MTNKYMYFIANWKMYGDLKSLNSLNKVLKFSNKHKKKKIKLIYCPPYTLLDSFSKKIRKSKIELGAQNCHYEISSGPFTGSISPSMLKKIGSNYVIIGHSENRTDGENDFQINKKIKSSIKSGLKIMVDEFERLENENFLDPEAVADIANKITVRIEGATQGSGVLVKKQGNIYTVLSASHVFKNHYLNVQKTP